MLELSSEIFDHLNRGGTLLVPSRQRATAVRLAYSAAMLARGHQLWNSPDVLPWSAWLERELDEARSRGEPLPRRLTFAEEWLLWQEAVRESCTGLEVLMPDGMIDPVRQAATLLDDYGIDLRSTPTAEAAVLRSAIAHFRTRCSEFGVVGRASWRGLTSWLRSSDRLLICDAAILGRERVEWLTEHGARLAEVGGKSGSCLIGDFETTSDEADAAASWCASQLAIDPNARLLVIVPALLQARHLWERAFAQRLDQTLILSGQAGSGASGFVIEGGQTLTGYPLVSTALQLVALANNSAQFDDLSAVLRTPYLSIVPRRWSLSVDRWLREHSVATGRVRVLRTILSLIAKDLGDDAAAALERLLAAVEAAGRSSPATPREWAEVWVDLLEACGWPGSATLSSDEQQVRMRFDELLGDFASVQVPTGQVTMREAASRLRSMAARVSFEPASDDVPVTITSRLEDPIVRYDGIWVAGLTSDVWPPAAKPDFLLPLPLQYAAGISVASARGQAVRARELQKRWVRCARECVLSWSRTSEDLPRDRSPLLPADSAPMSPLLAIEPLESQYATQAPALESWTDRTTPAQTVDGTLAGGTRLLELQSLCPFRAFAEIRLEATALEQPAPGIGPRLRGMILHLALELFWKETRDQATLIEKNTHARESLLQLVDRSIERAVRETLEREPATVSEQMKLQEHARTARLMMEMLKWELDRPAFSTTILESPLRHQFNGASLDLRLDRVDQLGDGMLLILDYKSGAPKTFDGLAERMRQPQLPAYAIASGMKTAGVAALYLGREGVKVRGATDDSSRINFRLAPRDGEPTWMERMQRWTQQLQLLVDEFLRGDAAVRPQPDACKVCHLHAFCRIDPAALAALDSDPDDPNGDESEEESEEEE